jgi:ElaB/YqjD/DUF883 family membrane-anchored ribosome-binding protein
MTNTVTPFKDQAADQASTVGEKLSDTATLVKDKVMDLGRDAVNRIDSNRDAAASGLDKAASALHANAGSLPGGDKVSGMAHDAAESLTTTAEYVREHDVNRMMADVTTLVKNNPGPSLVAAAVVGFLVGRAFSSND